ncbi:Ref family recombination enhancement nuclease [Enterobacter asburiae]|uniref:Ref family recombination enhancement nuclease n=1 Tax=Enterobacter asburiae TaxID=61645 RepID=UPI001CFB1493|nr:Ref family recombination enhancement nuclease [Enterobacter asburiae]MCB4615306.1 hypothetical protein [Enterobacter asburiae]
MNGRRPTKKERLYIEACIQHVGCIPCILDGREIENPAVWTEFHHDPDYGSTEPCCHFHGYGICSTHHRGVTPDGRSVEIAVRHPVASNGPRFATIYGPDELLCAMAWERIPDSVKNVIGFDLSTGEIPANFK